LSLIGSLFSALGGSSLSARRRPCTLRQLKAEGCPYHPLGWVHRPPFKDKSSVFIWVVIPSVCGT
jgi:hypothetical protein